MKQYIHVDSYKVVNAYLEHVKRTYKPGTKYKLIKSKNYFKYGYTVHGNRHPRYSNHGGQLGIGD